MAEPGKEWGLTTAMYLFDLRIVAFPGLERPMLTPEPKLSLEPLFADDIRFFYYRSPLEFTVEIFLSRLRI